MEREHQDHPDLVKPTLDMLWREIVAHDGDCWTEGWRLVSTVAGQLGVVVGYLAVQLEGKMTDPAESGRMWLDVIRLVVEGVARGRRGEY